MEVTPRPEERVQLQRVWELGPQGRLLHSGAFSAEARCALLGRLPAAGHCKNEVSFALFLFTRCRNVLDTAGRSAWALSLSGPQVTSSWLFYGPKPPTPTTGIA